MTRPPIAPPDPLVIDWLLSAFCRRLYVTAEMGVLACLEYPPERFAEFVEVQFCRPTKALAEVLRLTAAEGDVAAAAKPLEGLVLWSEMLGAAMLSMGRFREMPREDLRQVADRFGGAWFSLRNCIVEVAAALGAQVTCLRDMPAARDYAVRETLNVLREELERTQACR